MSYLYAPTEPVLANAAAWIDELKSGPGLARLMTAHGPRLLVVALILALALDSALILTRSLSQGTVAAPSTAPVGAPRPPVNPALKLATIVNAHMFGTTAVTNSSDAPPTTMALILAGVIADKDPAKGVAIVGQSAAAAKLYSVGAAIPGGARLHAVYGDRVLLERNGGLETLMLPRTPMAGLATSHNNIGPRPPAARDNSSLLAGLIRGQPYLPQGKFAGYTVFPNGPRGASAFAQMGLRAGDVIKSVNGTTLDDPARAMEVLQILSSAGSATVTVMRNNQSLDLSLNLASLNVDANDAGASAATDADATPNPTMAPITAPPAGPPPRPHFRGLQNLNATPGGPTGTSGNIATPATGGDSDTAPPAGSGEQREN